MELRAVVTKQQAKDRRGGGGGRGWGTGRRSELSWAEWRGRGREGRVGWEVEGGFWWTWEVLGNNRKGRQVTPKV